MKRFVFFSAFAFIAALLIGCSSASQSIYRYHAFFKKSYAGINDRFTAVPTADSTSSKHTVQKKGGGVDTTYLIYIETGETANPLIENVMINGISYVASASRLPPTELIIGTNAETTGNEKIVISHEAQKQWWQVELSVTKPTTAVGKIANEIIVTGSVNRKSFRLGLRPLELQPEARM